MEADCTKRDKWIFDLLQLEQREKFDLNQKSHTKWVVEGDENSNYFHATVNHRWRRNRVKGLILDGRWSSDPTTVKMDFLKHFVDRYKETFPSRPGSIALCLQNFRMRKFHFWPVV